MQDPGLIMRTICPLVLVHIITYSTVHSAFFMTTSTFLPKICSVVFRQGVTKPRGVAAGGRLREAEPS